MANPQMEEEALDRMFGDICDLFEQAFHVGEVAGLQPDTDPQRVKSTSNEARAFAAAVFDLIEPADG